MRPSLLTRQHLLPPSLATRPSRMLWLLDAYHCVLSYFLPFLILHLSSYAAYGPKYFFCFRAIPIAFLEKLLQLPFPSWLYMRYIDIISFLLKLVSNVITTAQPCVCSYLLWPTFAAAQLCFTRMLSCSAPPITASSTTSYIFELRCCTNYLFLKINLWVLYFVF